MDLYTIDEINLAGMENQLRHLLMPVDPDPQFVHHLQTRLTHKPSIVVDPVRKNTGFIVLLLGLLSGILLFIFLFRLFRNQPDEK